MKEKIVQIVCVICDGRRKGLCKPGDLCMSKDKFVALLKALIEQEQKAMREALEEAQGLLKEYKGRIQFTLDMAKFAAHDNVLERLTEGEAKIDAVLGGS